MSNGFLQSEEDHSLSGIAVTALFFDANSWLLVSGDQSGMVIRKFPCLCTWVRFFMK